MGKRLLICHFHPSVLPRRTIFYDVVEYLYSKKMSDQLAQELPDLLVQPRTEDIQLQHMNIISRLRWVPRRKPVEVKMLVLLICQALLSCQTLLSCHALFSCKVVFSCQTLFELSGSLELPSHLRPAFHVHVCAGAFQCTFLQKKKCISMHAETHLWNHGSCLVVTRCFHCLHKFKVMCMRVASVWATHMWNSRSLSGISTHG